MSDISKLSKVRAMTFSPNQSEAANARKLLERMMAEAGLSDDQLDDLISAETLHGAGATTSADGMPTLTDWGLYVDGRQSRYLLMQCVAYTVGWDRWMNNVRIMKRHRKYIFMGVTRAEADYITEIFQIHLKGLERAMMKQGVHKSQTGRKTTKFSRARQDSVRLAYCTLAALHIPGRPQVEARWEDLDETARAAMAMMRNISAESTPVKHDHRIGHPAGRSLTAGASKPRQLTDGGA